MDQSKRQRIRFFERFQRELKLAEECAAIQKKKVVITPELLEVVSSLPQILNSESVLERN